MATDEEGKPRFLLGLCVPQSRDAARSLLSSRDGDTKSRYDFVTTDLPDNMEARSDVTALEGRWWMSSVVGRMDAPCREKMEWAHHMGLSAVILPEIPTDEMEMHNYCQSVASLLPLASHTQLWVRTKLTEEGLLAFETLHRFCDSAVNVGMMLVMDQLSSRENISAARMANFHALIHKAIGCQLRAVCYPTMSFLKNKKGFPTLSKNNQSLFIQILCRLHSKVHWLVDAPNVVSDDEDDTPSIFVYAKYLRHLRQNDKVTQAIDTAQWAMEVNYLDRLQSPLQPLGDHLEFDTYETFEQDPVKYQQYQKAIYMALRDKAATEMTIAVVVVGAGRGKLVKATLDSAEQLALSTRTIVFCVEKNPSSVVFLNSKNRCEWGDRVTVVHADMRQLSETSLGGVHADIVISELLGSFGDNELSPECLDGLYKTGLCKDTTVSIPSRYTSFLAPISSTRLHSEARAEAFLPSSPTDGPDCSQKGNQRAMETPYVVRTHAASQTHMEQECWSFSHFNKDKAASQERYAHLQFEPDPMHGAGCGPGYGPYDPTFDAEAKILTTSGYMTIHGFIGTFDAILYSSGGEDIRISICPHNFSKGMFSWFPLYFPLKEPLKVPPDSTITCSIWRRTQVTHGGSGRVWYEWCAKVTDAQNTLVGLTIIHNPHGRSCHVKL